jgi:hypothetical protein
MSFIPATAGPEADQIVPNDGWFPDLSVAQMKAQTGLGQIFGADQVAAALRSAMIEVNASIRAWRTVQAAPTLADVQAESYGGTSAKVTLYTTAVYARARALLLEVTRDYDSTKAGHGRADALEDTAITYLRQSNEALARLIDRPRTMVELI